MALSLQVSNNLDQLAASFCQEMRRSPGAVFAPEFIITQTEGMMNWLRLQISRANGIAANLRFVRPNDILHEVYFRLGGPREQVLASDHLQWILFTVLDTAEFRRRYPSIAAYYGEEDEIKRLALARKVADLFDQYQVYRPDFIRDWSEGKEAGAGDGWQSWLWRHVRKQYGPVIPDKTVLADYITEALRDPARVQGLQARLPRVQLFGLSILTAFHIDLFHRLAEHIDIRFYLLNPAPECYWYEDRSPRQLARWRRLPRHENRAVPAVGNTLLTNWGRVIQDTFGLLFAHDAFLNCYDDRAVTEPEPVSLLKKIQYDLFTNAVEPERQQFTAADLEDGTLSLNACYTVAREVEVLYNYLVRLVAEDKLHSPREVVVMVNDIHTYAPYIRAVFDAAPYLFPYSIADESVAEDRGFFGALQAVMSLEEDYFGAETVLALLEYEAIRARFRITRPELIRRAVGEANIRFGMKGSVADESVTVSWENGLKRILYGICMLDAGEYTDDGYGFYPLDLAEGEEALELVRFVHFAEVLMSVTTERREPRGLAAWGRYLEEAAEHLLAPAAGEEGDYGLFSQYLERLAGIAGVMDETLSFQVFRESFIERMAGETRPGNFIAGGITFCSLIPMRSIPFKTIAMLGLNFDAFPRKEKQLTFDLTRRQPRRGDRNVRDNDKHLFLETLLSARERLYISYIGRSSKDSTSQPPSALVDELTAYIREAASGGELPVTLHPLHGFSARYGEAGGLYTYLGNRSGALPLETREQEPAAAELPPEIGLAEFISFFKDPFKYYYTRRLGIYYNTRQVLLSDTELFTLDGLEEWALKNDLLFLEEDDLPHYRDKAVKLGRLPLRHMADLEIAEVTTAIDGVRRRVRESMAGKTKHLQAIQLPLGASAMTGEMDVYGDRLLTVCFSANERKYCLEAYIRHLVATAAGWQLDTYFISQQREEAVIIPRDRFTTEEANERLLALLACFGEGSSRLLAYSPVVPVDPDKLASLTEEQFRLALSRRQESPGRVSDPYFLQLYERGFFFTTEVFEDYVRLAGEIYGPVHAVFNPP